MLTKKLNLDLDDNKNRVFDTVKDQILFLRTSLNIIKDKTYIPKD